MTPFLFRWITWAGQARAAWTGVLCLIGMMFTGCGGPDILVRADEPLTLAEVQRRKECNFPFPDSARQIHYGIYADWAAQEYLIRFDAPPEDCVATIAKAMAWHSGPKRPATTQPFRGALPECIWLSPVRWFEGASIQRGVYAGEDSSHTPQIWVDLENGRFFYSTRD